MEEVKMTFKFTVAEAKAIRNALGIAAEAYNNLEKAEACEKLYDFFTRRLQDKNELAE